MSRRLVISILLLLILGIIGGTIALVVSRLRQGQSPATTPTAQNTLQEAGSGKATIANPTADDDSDGLNNADEAIWGTDNKNPDTDGDGYNDGQEVTAGHNPTVPAPNDKLPDGFVPGKDINPLQEATTEAIPFDQLFVDNLDLSGGTRNLTEEYKKAYPDAAKTPSNLADFVAKQPMVTKLPTPKESLIVVQQQDGGTGAIRAYISSLNDFKPLSNKAVLQVALQELYTNDDPSTIQGMALTVHAYQQNLLRQSIPSSAVNLHKLLLGYTQLLEATFNQIALWNEDRVKALVGLSQLSEIDRTYYPLIIQETARLNSL